MLRFLAFSFFWKYIKKFIRSFNCLAMAQSSALLCGSGMKRKCCTIQSLTKLTSKDWAYFCMSTKSPKEVLRDSATQIVT